MKDNHFLSSGKTIFSTLKFFFCQRICSVELSQRSESVSSLKYSRTNFPVCVCVLVIKLMMEGRSPATDQRRIRTCCYSAHSKKCSPYDTPAYLGWLHLQTGPNDRGLGITYMAPPSTPFDPLNFSSVLLRRVLAILSMFCAATVQAATRHTSYSKDAR
jgi:hypothetical protein